eukprot:g307.t1
MAKIPANVDVSAHPVLKHKIAILRSEDTNPGMFRQLLKELTFYLGYETTRTLAVAPKEVQTPLAKTIGHALSEKIALVPILRAGLGMTDAMLELLPMSTVHHIGMYRTKASLLPVLYYNRLPETPDCDRVIILEPLVATGGSLSACVDLIKDWGIAGEKISVMSVLASTQGLQNLSERHPDVRIVVGCVDDVLTDGVILPGLGDVGDRLYCPGNKTKSSYSGNGTPLKRKRVQ